MVGTFLMLLEFPCNWVPHIIQQSHCSCPLKRGHFKRKGSSSSSRFLNGNVLSFHQTFEKKSATKHSNPLWHEIPYPFQNKIYNLDKINQSVTVGFGCLESWNSPLEKVSIYSTTWKIAIKVGSSLTQTYPNR